MSTPLKHALVDHPDPAWKVARGVPTTENRLSNLARGRATPSPLEVTRLSEILGRDPQELFPESPVTA